jgi:Uma2 family endonuclease
MYALISPEKTQLPPGTVVRMVGSWQEYCSLRDSRGAGSLPRIKYRGGEILLMNPLPRHGREANILADIVKAMLDSRDRNYEAFTPITMELPNTGGIEPDYCFYIDNWESVVGKDPIDWDVDSPPDLVIEIDITSYTAVEDFLPYGVPEVWLFKQGQLRIFGLASGSYVQISTSRYFPEIDLPETIHQCLLLAAEQGTGNALRSLRQRLALDL